MSHETRKKRPSGSGLPVIEARMVDALHPPESWRSLGADVLELIAFSRMSRYGDSKDAGELTELRSLYALLLERLPARRRLRLEQMLCRLGMDGWSSAAMLTPFLEQETDKAVISSAAIDYAMLAPRLDGDPLTGPKALVARFEQAEGNDDLRLGLLTGLILLGDERVLPLVRGLWRALPRVEDRQALAAANSGIVSTLLVEFLLDWLEDTTDERDIGSIAGAMARMPLNATVPFVVRQQRCFPAREAPPGEEIRTLEQWTFSAYTDRIRHRLEPLIARETSPKLIPAIAEGWSYAP